MRAGAVAVSSTNFDNPVNQGDHGVRTAGQAHLKARHAVGVLLKLGLSRR